MNQFFTSAQVVIPWLFWGVVMFAGVAVFASGLVKWIASGVGSGDRKLNTACIMLAGIGVTTTAYFVYAWWRMMPQ